MLRAGRRRRVVTQQQYASRLGGQQSVALCASDAPLAAHNGREHSAKRDRKSADASASGASQRSERSSASSLGFRRGYEYLQEAEYTENCSASGR